MLSSLLAQPLSVNLFLLRLASLCRALWRLGPVCAALAGGQATAAGFTVLLADDSAPHAEFARQMRTPAEGTTATIAVGMAAARAAIDRPGAEPLLLAMLTHLDYERLRDDPRLLRTDRRVGVLLRDPAMADQLALIDAVLPPKKRRLGVVATFGSESLVRELERAAAGWDLTVQYAPSPTALATALRSVVARSDALMVLPDRIGDSQAATLSVLLAGAGATLPVFGASDGLVRSGGLAAAVSTPTQLAAQARAIVQKLRHGAGGVVLVEAATPATVRVNTTVARGLGLHLPDERALTERVTAPR